MFRGVPTARHMMCTIKQGLKPLPIAVQSLRDENRQKSPYLCQTPAANREIGVPESQRCSASLDRQDCLSYIP